MSRNTASATRINVSGSSIEQAIPQKGELEKLCRLNGCGVAVWAARADSNEQFAPHLFHSEWLINPRDLSIPTYLV